MLERNLKMTIVKKRVEQPVNCDKCEYFRCNLMKIAVRSWMRLRARAA